MPVDRAAGWRKLAVELGPVVARRYWAGEGSSALAREYGISVTYVRTLALKFEQQAKAGPQPGDRCDLCRVTVGDWKAHLESQLHVENLPQPESPAPPLAGTNSNAYCIQCKHGVQDMARHLTSEDHMRYVRRQEDNE